MTGSMIINNNLGSKTLLSLTEKGATSDAPEISTSINDARAALIREKASPSIRQGNIKFLEAWIKSATQVPNYPPIISPPYNPPIISPPPYNPPIPPSTSITPPQKTSIRLKDQPWEKDNYLKVEKEEEDATT